MKKGLPAQAGLWHKRMPTLVAFLLLLIGVWVTSFLIQKGTLLTGQATPDKTPKNVKIGNITSSSFTVAFTTEDKSLAGLSVEEVGKNPYVVLDDRNKKEARRDEFYSHYFTVSGLSPETSYNFTVLVNGKEYKDGDKKYFVRTGPEIGPPPETGQNPIRGRGLSVDGQAASDAIVELKIQGAQEIVFLTSESGEFTIPVNSIRKENLSEYISLTPDTPITLILRKQNMISTTQFFLKNAYNLDGLTLGQDYNFTDISKDEFSTKSSELRAPTTKFGLGTIKIISPRENESFVDTKPLFKGTALPNQKVRIKIESEVIIDEVTADANGVWTYRPLLPLPPGQHKITIETLDSFGISKILTQSFMVFAQGSQIAESATPSATPTFAPLPTATPTPTPTVLPTATPTPPPQPLVTASPTQIPVVTPAPPGNTSSLVLAAISILLIFAGSALLFVL